MHIDNRVLHGNVHNQYQGQTMQASLCFRAACPINARNQHYYVLHGLREDRGQFTLNLSSLLNRRIISPLIRAHMTHPESNISKKDEVKRIGHLKPVAAAVIMACTLGAMCANEKAIAGGFYSSPSTTSESNHAPASNPTREDTRKKSIQALREIFDWKCDFGTQKSAPTPKILLEILSDELQKDEFQKLKKYLKQLESIEKSKEAVNSIFEEWQRRPHDGETYNIGLVLTDLLINQIIEKSKEAVNSIFEEWQQRPHDSETYIIGLVLIDLLISQDDYKRAAFVCQNIESYAPKFDIRPKLRRAILDMMLLADAVGSEVKESEKTRRLKRKLNSVVWKFIEIIQENLDPPFD